MTVATDRNQMWRIWKPGRVESQTAGIAKVIILVALLITDGIVLPNAWNIPEPLQLRPDDMKSHEMTCRNPAAIEMTVASGVKNCTMRSAPSWHTTKSTDMSARPIPADVVKVFRVRSWNPAPKFWPATGAAANATAIAGRKIAC